MAKNSKYGNVLCERGTIPTDEPVFVLRAQDRLAAPLVMFYALMKSIGGDDKEAAECRAMAELMERWPVKK